MGKKKEESSSSSSSDVSDDDLELAKKINDVISCIAPAFETSCNQTEKKKEAKEEAPLLTEDERFQERMFHRLQKKLENTVSFVSDKEKTANEEKKSSIETPLPLPSPPSPNFGIKLFASSKKLITKIEGDDKQNKEISVINFENEAENDNTNNETLKISKLIRKEYFLRHDERKNKKLHRKYKKESIFQPTPSNFNTTPFSSPFNGTVVDHKEDIDHRSRYWLSSDDRINSRIPNSFSITSAHNYYYYKNNYDVPYYNDESNNNENISEVNANNTNENKINNNESKQNNLNKKEQNSYTNKNNGANINKNGRKSVNQKQSDTPSNNTFVHPCLLKKAKK